MKPFVAAASLALLALLIFFLADSKGPERAPLSGREATQVPGGGDAPLQTPADTPASSRRAGAAPESPADRPPLVATGPRADGAVSVRARLCTWDGAALVGCELALATRPEFRGMSESGGRVELRLPRATLEALASVTRDRQVEFLASGPGFAASAVRVPPNVQDDVLELGELVLQPGGAVGGRVLTANGLAVLGALVVLHPGSIFNASYQLPSDAAPPDLDDPGSRGSVPPLWTYSASDGSFQFPSVPPMRCIVWARGPTSLWTHSEALEIQVDAEARDVELRLIEDDSRTITGRVLDPEGAPVASHAVQFHLAGTGGPLAYSRTGPDGSFHFTSKTPDTIYDLSARALRDTWADLRHAAVLSGTHGLVLQFEVAPSLRVELVDQEGRPIEGGSATLLQPERWPALPLKRGKFAAGASGQLSVRRHETPFRLRAAAPGYRDTLVGPLDPATCGDVLHVVLERLPALVGRVTLQDGSPAAGAQVSLHFSAEGLYRHALGARSATQATGLTHAEWNGDGAPFVHALLIDASATVAADTEGRFRLPLPGVDTRANLEPRPPENEKRRVLPIAGRASNIDLKVAVDCSWYVRAALPGKASSTSGPHRFDPAHDEAVDLMLPLGGALAGDLRVEGHSDAAGWSVYATDGLGQLTCARVDTEGAFRFEALHAGPWQVRAFAPGRTCSLEGASVSNGTGVAPTIDVEVQAGVEARLSITARAPTRALLQGRVTLDGSSPGPWQVRHGSRGIRGTAEDDHATLDLQGAFRFSTAPSTDAEIWLMGQFRGSAWSIFGKVAVVTGLNSWDQELRLARVEVRGPGVSTTALRYESERPGMHIQVDPRGGAPESGAQWFVPAGPGQLELRDTRDRDAPLVKRTLDLAPGEVFVLELP